MNLKSFRGTSSLRLLDHSLIDRAHVLTALAYIRDRVAFDNWRNSVKPDFLASETRG